VLSEGGTGWVPYFLARADYVYEHHHQWTGQEFGDVKPSEVFRRQIVSCFFEDPIGVELRHQIGIDMITWECDYPHSDSTWPEAPERLWPVLRDLPREDVDKMTHLNAMRVFRYDPFATLPREQCSVGALRARAQHVDLTPIRGVGGRPPGLGKGRSRAHGADREAARRARSTGRGRNARRTLRSRVIRVASLGLFAASLGVASCSADTCKTELAAQYMPPLKEPVHSRFDEALGELAAVRNAYVIDNLCWYRDHAGGAHVEVSQPRHGDDRAGRFGSPARRSERQMRTHALPAVSVAIAALTGINATYQWQEQWQGFRQAQFEIEGRLSIWMLQVMRARDDPDAAHGIQVASDATEPWFATPRRSWRRETGAYFASVETPKPHGAQ